MKKYLLVKALIVLLAAISAVAIIRIVNKETECICDDNIDNDQDTLWDCDDPDCLEHSVCFN